MGWHGIVPAQGFPQGQDRASHDIALLLPHSAAARGRVLTIRPMGASTCSAVERRLRIRGITKLNANSANSVIGASSGIRA